MFLGVGLYTAGEVEVVVWMAVTGICIVGEETAEMMLSIETVREIAVLTVDS